jgi:hypothetical protein
MDPLLATVIRPTDSPLICQQEDGSWRLDLPDAGVTVVLSTEQLRRVVDDYLAQSLGGPFEDDEPR